MSEPEPISDVEAGSKRRVLVVDDDDGFTSALSEYLELKGFEVRVVRTVHHARDALGEGPFDVCLVDLLLPDGSGLELLESLPEDDGPRAIVLTAHPSVDRVVASLRARVFDFLIKPLDMAKLEACLDLSRDAPPTAPQAGEEAPSASWSDFLLGESPAMREIGQLIETVAPTDNTVLIEGESGTGKELAARAVHALSTRRARPFLALNCGALPEALVGSELFGHERGSFTGASRQHKGYFERAAGGTLFLDEIGEMPLELQVHLLRVLETGRFTRVGGTREIDCDARIVAASNQPLEEAVRAGAFREDLFFRLMVFPLHMPPLSARGEDVELLAAHFLGLVNEQSGKDVRMDDEAIAALRRHAWSGNVRELRNVVQRAHLLAGDADIDEKIVDQALSVFPSTSADPLSMRVGMSVQEAERRLIEATLEAFGGDKPRAAETLGISLKTLYNRLKAFEPSSGSPPGD